MNIMHWQGSANTPGVYELRADDDTLAGRVLLDARNAGAASISLGAAAFNFLFEYDDGIFKKKTRVYGKTLKDKLGEMPLDVMDNGVFTLATGEKFSWKYTSAGEDDRVWKNEQGASVLRFYLANKANVKIKMMVESAGEGLSCLPTLMALGWYLIVVQSRRTKDKTLAGALVITPDMAALAKQEAEDLKREYRNAWDEVKREANLDGVGRAAKDALRDAAAEDMVDELISSAADLAAALLGNNK